LFANAATAFWRDWTARHDPFAIVSKIAKDAINVLAVERIANRLQ
jgi:hypothetical protein